MGDAPRSEQFDDVYFSAADGPGETAHVFLNGNDLPARWQGARRFTIGETGFGTGLNFLLAWELFDRTAPKDALLDFVSVEKFPLSAAKIRSALSPWAARLAPYLDKMLAQYPMQIPGFHRMVFDGRVALTLIFDDANDALEEIEGQVDAWFLDGFTPAKNPEMWTEKVFGEMARLSHAGTSFATFTAAGFVKRGLEAAGFNVEKRKGFGPKRDMLAGRYTGPNLKTNTSIPDKIVIHGAGLAGSAAAYVLRQYGFDRVLYDPHGPASGASGNGAGLINPRLSAHRTAESDFYAAGFAQTVRVFSTLRDIDYLPCGSLHLITDNDKLKRFDGTRRNWGWDPETLQLLNESEAADAAGISLNKGALHLPQSARVSPVKLCRMYTENTPIITDRAPDGAVHVYATGAGGIEGLPLQPVRGQITFGKVTNISAALKTNVCYGGYISAPLEGSHAIGSTFQKWLSDTNLRPEDDRDNLARLSNNLPGLGELPVTGARASLRMTSPDRFPVIGCHQGGYVSVAHGSHGIVSSLIGAHVLADYLRGGPFCVSRATLHALRPSRFLERAAKKPPVNP